MNKEWIKNGLLLAACALSCWYVWFGPGQGQGPVTPVYQVELEKMRQRNDSLACENARLDSINRELTDEADSLWVVLVEDRHVVQQLKVKKDEVVHTISHYDGGQLLEFFSGLDADSTAGQ